MAERGSGSTPKRVSRSRRRSAASTVQEREGLDLDVSPEVADRPPQPAIEEAFEEAAAARREIEFAPPSERDMDFETLDAPPAAAERERVADAEGGTAAAPAAASESTPLSPEGEEVAAPSEGSEGFEGGGSRRRRRRRRRGRGGGGEVSQSNGGYGRQGQRFRGNGGAAPQRGGSAPRPQHGGQPAGPRPAEGPGTPVLGVLELHPKGYGFLRDAKAGYFSQETDPFVSSSLIEKFGLREGVQITGEAVPGGRGQGPRLRQIDTVEGRTPEAYQQVRNFDDLTPITPFQQIKLETGPTPITMRVMDLLTPIAKGQRALLVAPPRTGKTMLLQEIADAVSKNHPEIYLIVLLIDERPEEVTEMKRRVHGEVIASSLDREVESHIRVSQLVFERAKRMAETGRDVFVLLDSITRTARAFNKWSNSGRTGTGGLDIRAMDIPKKMFGLARQFEEGGSLTVVGTALIDTGSRMDEAIFQEFKGTGNMEMVLSRDLADRRIWPAIDITKSGTRREEKILPPETLEAVTTLRRSLISMSPVEAMEQLIRTLAKFPTNAEFLQRVRSVL
uniref:Transcription termination factor Rho n=1 Tax=Schlesneria paludicola TaxID=360056 RepID=A0A7C4QQ18_9PLAN